MGKKIIAFIILLLLLIGGKWVLWDMEISSGKRVGNLVKISKKGRVPFLQTWEGTLDEGSGDKLTSYFSVKNDALAQELYTYEGKEVVLFYTQHLVGWPRDTNYVVTAWKPKEVPAKAQLENVVEGSASLQLLSKNLFCSFLGAIYTDQELYEKVKDHISKNNPFLLAQYKKCND